MESRQFDRFARACGGAANRRAIAGALVGVALTSVSHGMFGLDYTNAKKKKKHKKKRCKGKKKKCGNGCVRKKQCCTNGTSGCPWSLNCEGGSCIDCSGLSCSVDGECCTRICENGVCVCYFGTAGPEGGCTDDRQCCNHQCILETGKCACDPDGSLCPFGDGSACCSGFCNSDNICAPVP